jgi:hypothetical protein
MKEMNDERVSAKEAWERLDDFLGEAEMDRLEKLSPEEVQSELAAAGLLKEEGAEATKDVATGAPSGPKLAPAEPTSPAVVAARFDEEAPEGVPSGNVRSLEAHGDAKGRRSVARYVVYAAVAAVLGVAAAKGLGVFGDRHVVQPTPQERPTPREVPRREGPRDDDEARARAVALRGDAKRACDRSDWALCLKALGAARAADPSGDTAGDVQGLWDLANEGQRREDKGKGSGR